MASTCPAIEHVSWNLTRRCNLACGHCYLDASARADRAGELTTAEALRIVDEIAAVNPETMIVFSGGEPMIREDLPLLIERAAGHGMMTLLGSNGTMLAAADARRLRACGLRGAGISLDSLDPERHDRFRGLAGAWRRSVDALEACREAGVETQVQMTVTAANLHELDAMAVFAREEGARVFVVFFLVCTGRGQQMVDIDSEAYERALRRIVELSRGNSRRFMVRPRCAPHFRRVLYEREPASPLLLTDAGRCLAGRTYCRITPEGVVTPCPYIEVAAGDLRAAPFGEIWRDSAVLGRLRAPALSGKCGECALRELCGGCRARAAAATGNLMGADPSCGYEGAARTPVRVAEPAPVEGVSWTPEAEARLRRIPGFVRGFVRRALERRAAEGGVGRIDAEFMARARGEMDPTRR